ncbi:MULTISPECIES: peptidase domain-containing ABC transporter [unclassified Chitinophaga]|uniref:peptidase domain-containing ABC transporter n=1 Tax=unclassified Chitinophaga TaxID=2619133 RepID=UPI00301055D8
MSPFRFYKQLNKMDCGVACLRMVSNYYGKHYNTEILRKITGFNKEGVSLLGISEAAEEIGFTTTGVQLTYEQLTKDVQLPCILHWNQNHFVVLYSNSNSKSNKKIRIADPETGIATYTAKEFQQHWISSTENGEETGIALLLSPGPTFSKMDHEEESKLAWLQLLQYLKQHRWKIAQVFIALLITSLLQLAFPFLTKSIVDKGINAKNFSYLTLILIAQLTLVFSRTIVDFIRSRQLLTISISINLSILSDFWAKLIRLPLSYFDNHHTGDTLQRLNDNKQIQSFLTGSAITTLFSLLNFAVFTIVLLTYSFKIFFIFCISSILYILWIKLFLGIRKKINHQTFHLSARENNATLQLVQGMQEIRLNSAEHLRQEEWTEIQQDIFKLNKKSLIYNQFQQAGALLISQGKDFVITFTVAQLVIQDKLTFGVMLAVQYIIGQLSNPIEQLITFIQGAQDTKISLERLNEIHQRKDEEDRYTTYITPPGSKDIYINNLSFTYPGAGNTPVLNDINLHIPEGKVTAIVGMSGSGKTSILKLLLKVYDEYKGEIKVGESDFRCIQPSYWRKQCGAVLQDGYIFNDTISRNIAVSEKVPEHSKLIACAEIANILPFITSLPNGFNTQLGSEGVGISQGQRQRLLIARALYKNPQYLFFDEATNALDANNEKVIIDNLQTFFEGKTVIVIAHRLSTVKNADKIIVLHQGKIAEEGTHLQLSALKGRYFELVQNQLELDR